jgi:hypothetical protein
VYSVVFLLLRHTEVIFIESNKKKHQEHKKMGHREKMRPNGVYVARIPTEYEQIFRQDVMFNRLLSSFKDKGGSFTNAPLYFT